MANDETIKEPEEAIEPEAPIETPEEPAKEPEEVEGPNEHVRRDANGALIINAV